MEPTLLGFLTDPLFWVPTIALAAALFAQQAPHAAPCKYHAATATRGPFQAANPSQN